MKTIEKFKEFLAEKIEDAGRQTATFAGRFAKEPAEAMRWAGDSACVAAAMITVARDVLSYIERTEHARAVSGGTLTVQQVEHHIVDRALTAATDSARPGVAGVIYQATTQALAELAIEFRMLVRFEAEFSKAVA